MGERSFFSLVFDMSFTRFVTPSIVRIVFVLAIVVSGLAALGFVATFSAGEFSLAIFPLLLVAALIFFVNVIVSRVALEAVVALFRIADNSSVLAEEARRSATTD